MGKVEKVIVLSVLFLIALILVVSVTVDDPLDKSRVVEAGGKPAPTVAQVPPGQTPAQTPVPPPVLSSTVQSSTVQPAGPTVPVVSPAPAPAPTTPTVAAQSAPQPAPEVATATGLPPGALLTKLDGLENSFFDDLKLYTWKEGDSWRKIANDYYGNWERLDVLKRHNEGRMDVQPGEKVFVPVFAEERAAVAAAPAPTPSNAAPNAIAKPAPTASSKKVHVVKAGESLWKIAKAELGDGNRWKEIYEVNKDLLKSNPESVKKGMRLRIP